jgi:hypothetical protein
MSHRALHKKSATSRRARGANPPRKRRATAPLAERIPRGATFRRQEVRCGKGHCWCRWGGAAHGPYWYAFWKERRRTKSAYIGDEDKLRQLLNDRADLRDPDEDLERLAVHQPRLGGGAAAPACHRARLGRGVRSRA